MTLAFLAASLLLLLIIYLEHSTVLLNLRGAAGGTQVLFFVNLVSETLSADNLGCDCQPQF